MSLELSRLTPAGVRAHFRTDPEPRPTAGLAPGYAQANLIILPREYAYDFLLFAPRNPRACPVLEVTEAGQRDLPFLAPDGDVARDFPLYRVYRDGVLQSELRSVEHLWRDDLVSFLIGCSFSFEWALQRAGVPVRHIEENRNVPMYLTNIPCKSAGVFSGNMVVSMRPIPAGLIPLAVTTTAQMPRVHGAPVHVGDPAAIGIADLARPDFGDAVTIRPGELPVFWPCGVTPQAAVMQSRPSLAITHAPGHMLVCDVPNDALMG